MDNYVVLRQMAEAIYGQVLLCRDDTTAELVAVKKISMSRAATRQSETHLVHENAIQELEMNHRVQAAGGHGYICRLRDDFYFQDGDDTMLAMVFDYCPRGELLHALSLAKRFDQHAALEYVAQIAQAIDFLHMHEIAHRDISLENVLLTDGHCIQLCDFGLACHATQCTNETVGKLLYMAPEVLAGQTYIPKQADMWSLGVALFTMVVGHYPFHEASMYDAFYSIHARLGLAALLRKHNVAWISPDMQELLGHLLDVDPLNRYTIRHMLAHALVRPCLGQNVEGSLSTVSLEHEAAGKECPEQNVPEAPSPPRPVAAAAPIMTIRSPQVVQGHAPLLPRPKTSIRTYLKQKLSHFRIRWTKS
ncbi:hypothetical protein LEN26_016295 [Aphanomyces euteiches]|nr:hypothetical protein LEN26_016295 [Aphanomyces euteiches]KAH9105354.1 hypothetical protein AeMF1_018805 [Aphanomyces euteiches]KAH9195483.1 hypothetical protein AeNC1_002547 [Aphanomyces euteiches]